MPEALLKTEVCSMNPIFLPSGLQNAFAQSVLLTSRALDFVGWIRTGGLMGGV